MREKERERERERVRQIANEREIAKHRDQNSKRGGGRKIEKKRVRGPQKE